jgi:hypothetical protein
MHAVEPWQLDAHNIIGSRTVFGDIMEIVTADDNGTGHFGGNNAPCKDATTDRNFAGKWTLLVYIHQLRL